MVLKDVTETGHACPLSNGLDRTSTSPLNGFRPDILGHLDRTPASSRTLRKNPLNNRGSETQTNGATNSNGAGKKYAFEGQTIRLSPAQIEKWRVAYPALPDIEAVLQSADDYYTENPPADGKWFFRVSRWLAAENGKRLAKQQQIERANDSW